jgi:hypothetical protein
MGIPANYLRGAAGMGLGTTIWAARLNTCDAQRAAQRATAGRNDQYMRYKTSASQATA